MCPVQFCTSLVEGYPKVSLVGTGCYARPRGLVHMYVRTFLHKNLNPPSARNKVEAVGS